MIEQAHQSTANQMIREGSTPGMVTQYLRSQGLRDHQCERVVENAVNSRKNSTRAKGIFLVLLGLGVIFGCGSWIVFEVNFRARPLVRLPFGLAMFGLIMILKGMVDVVGTSRSG